MSESFISVPRSNILTITVEDYFQVGAFSRLIPSSRWERFDARLKNNTQLALDLLAATNTSATFFASGWIGEHYPEILRSIVDAGHELACQAYYQQAVHEISPRAFRDDVRRSRETIQNATGQAVQGFRVGRGRIGPEDLWALDVLQEEGFRYDASVSPIGRQFSREPQRFYLHQHETKEGSIWEIPVSATSIFGNAVPFSGGNYIRQLPRWLTRELVARWVARRHAPLVMYFHIWELDYDQPLISAANWLQRIRHYRNLDEMPERIEHFLNLYPFTSISQYLSLDGAAVATQHDHSPNVFEPDPHLAQPLSDAIGNLTIVIPCYNEEASLTYLSKTLDRFMSAAGENLKTKFVFVDDGSVDSTWEKLNQKFGEQSNCTVLRHAKNKGIAAAIITGFAACEDDLIAVLDADCTFDPMQLFEMLPMLTEEISVVAASPLHSHGNIANVPGWRLLLSRGAAFLYRCVLHHQFTSYTSCFRIYRRSAVRELRIHNLGFCGVAEILARIDLAGHKMIECPAKLETRLLGESKINLLRTIFDHIKLIARIAAKRWLEIPMPESDAR